MSAAERIAALSAPFVPTPVIFEGEDNDPAVKAWNRRQGALAAIEANGTFFDAESCARQQMELFDALEEGFRFVPAETLQGVLAKLWVALSHLGPAPADHADDERRREVLAEHDAIRRADTGDVASFIGGWDFGEEVLFGAIRDLERLSRFDRVVPTQKGGM